MKRISYFYDPLIGKFYYSSGHSMRPLRIQVTHSLISNYGLYKKMYVFRPERAYKNLVNFHSNFLQTVCNAKEMMSDLQRYNVCDDCPVL